jgi:hypothetical protein
MNPYFWLKNPKANFLKNPVTVSFAKAGGYEIDLDFWLKNPKANFLKNPVFISFCNTEGYETDLDFWPKNPKAKTKPTCPELACPERSRMGRTYFQNGKNECKLLLHNELRTKSYEFTP